LIVEYEFKIVGELFEWRGPAPFYFIKVDPKSSAIIKKSAAALSYGWGVLHIHGEVSKLQFQTALIPKDGVYYLPIKNEIRKKLDLQLDDEIKVKFNLGKLK